MDPDMQKSSHPRGNHSMTTRRGGELNANPVGNHTMTGGGGERTANPPSVNHSMTGSETLNQAAEPRVDDSRNGEKTMNQASTPIVNQGLTASNPAPELLDPLHNIPQISIPEVVQHESAYLSNEDINRVLCLPPQDQIADHVPILEPHMSTPMSRSGSAHIQLTIGTFSSQRKSVIMMNRKN